MIVPDKKVRKIIEDAWLAGLNLEEVLHAGRRAGVQFTAKQLREVRLAWSDMNLELDFHQFYPLIIEKRRNAK